MVAPKSNTAVAIDSAKAHEIPYIARELVILPTTKQVFYTRNNREDSYQLRFDALVERCEIERFRLYIHEWFVPRRSFRYRFDKHYH